MSKMPKDPAQDNEPNERAFTRVLLLDGTAIEGPKHSVEEGVFWFGDLNDDAVRGVPLHQIRDIQIVYKRPKPPLKITRPKSPTE